jgi:23S rRNA (pseudouridine1915-N3)-methyltransferase
MYHVKIVTVGKIREQWLLLALKEYEKRLTPHMQIVWQIHKKEEDMYASLRLEKKFICLTPDGRSFTSETFSQLVTSAPAHLFVIGGPDGIPPDVLQRTDLCLSLSPLTFTHLHTRLILLEQLYRAIEINRGSSYHK